MLATGGAIATSGLLAPVGLSRAEEHSSELSLDDSTGWSSYHGNPGNTAAVPTDEPISAPDTVAWRYDEEGDIAVLDGAVYLRTGGEVHALEDETGERRWIAEGIDAAGTPAALEEAVFVGGDRLTALEASSGDVRWEESFDDDEGVPSPTVAFGTVYVVVGETLYAFDAETGSLSWERSSVEVETTDGDETVSFRSTTVAVANDLVYAEIGSSGFVALDATNGTTEWTYWWGYSNEPHGYLVATSERLYTGQISDGEEYPVLDAQTGERIAYTSYRFPLAATDDVQVRTNRHSVRLSEYESGDSWSVGGTTDEWGRPVIVGETVIVPSHSMADEPAIFGFDIADGSQQWALRLTGIDINTLEGNTWPSDSFVATEDTIYITSPSQLAAIRSSPEGDEEGDEEPGEESEDVESEDVESDGDSEDELESNESADDGDGVSEIAESTNESETGSSTESTNESTDDSENISVDDGKNGADNESGSGSANVSQNESTDGTENETDGDATPGFTTGAGIVSGALGLEWLRRRSKRGEPTALDAESDELNE
ncbi:hypothetical protein JCM18750_32920 [Halostagnicola bangensis]